MLSDFIKYIFTISLIAVGLLAYDTTIFEALTDTYVHADPSGSLFVVTFIGGFVLLGLFGLIPIYLKYSGRFYNLSQWILAAVLIGVVQICLLWFGFGLKPRNVEPASLQIKLGVLRSAIIFLTIIVGWLVLRSDSTNDRTEG